MSEILRESFNTLYKSYVGHEFTDETLFGFYKHAVEFGYSKALEVHAQERQAWELMLRLMEKGARVQFEVPPIDPDLMTSGAHRLNVPVDHELESFERNEK